MLLPSCSAWLLPAPLLLWHACGQLCRQLACPEQALPHRTHAAAQKVTSCFTQCDKNCVTYTRDNYGLFQRLTLDMGKCVQGGQAAVDSACCLQPTTTPGSFAPCGTPGVTAPGNTPPLPTGELPCGGSVPTDSLAVGGDRGGTQPVCIDSTTMYVDVDRGG